MSSFGVFVGSMRLVQCLRFHHWLLGIKRLEKAFFILLNVLLIRSKAEAEGLHFGIFSELEIF